MSGPWDRPSSPSPDDREQTWPAEDLESSPSPRPPAEPWSPDDPWQERRDPNQGWDGWTVAPDDYAYAPPDLPSSDPWAESWTDEAAAEQPYAGEPAWQPEPEQPIVADEAPASEPIAYEPPTVEPAASEPMPEPPSAFAPAPSPEAAPTIEPWSPDSDPWGIATPDAWTPEPETAEPESVPPEPVASVEPEPMVVGPPAVETPPVWDPDAAPAPMSEADAALELESEPVASVEAEPAPEAPGASPDTNGGLPDWLADASPEFASIFGPISTETPEATDQPAAPAAEPEPIFAPEPAVTDAAAAEPAAEAASEIAATDVERTPAVDAEPVADTEPPAAEPPVAEPPAAEAPAAESPVSDQPPWAAALWDEPTIEPGPSIEPEPAFQAEPAYEPPPQPEPEPMAAAVDAPPDEGTVHPDATQVYSSDWTPPQPGTLEPLEGTIRTSLAERGELDGELYPQPSTAEQAVPWLIGLILLLAGMVIVLLALIFAGDASLGGGASLPSPTNAGFVAQPSDSGGPLAGGGADGSHSARPSASATATSTPQPGPQYGALEMVYQGRAAALKPIYLLRRDFAVDEEPKVLAQDQTLDIHRVAWSPDGTVGAALYDDLLISVEAGDKRPLADGITAATFGPDATTVYAVRITADGANDKATIVAIDFASAESEDLATVTYTRPSIGEEDRLAEAQFADDGGTVRLFWTDDGQLYLWSLGAGAWTIDPGDGTAKESSNDDLPQLWSGDGRHRIVVSFKDDTTTLEVVNQSEAELGTTSVEGRVSHLRWSPDGKQVVFTVGRSASGGGVLQDLYLWNLDDAPDGCSADPASNCQMITNTGAAFGAEWLGTAARWEIGDPDA